MPSGGARPGAGRPRKTEKYEQPVNAAEQKIVDKLPKLVDNLLKLANGGYQQVTVQFEPAGLVMVGSGENETLAFPHLPPEQMVEVKRTVTRAAPDRAANQYLIDRIAGKPTAAVEIEQEHSGEVRVRVEYADPDSDASASA